MDDVIERNLVHLNFADGPDGTVSFGMQIPGETDRQSRAFLLAVQTLRWLESGAVCKVYEKIDGQLTNPTTLPAETL